MSTSNNDILKELLNLEYVVDQNQKNRIRTSYNDLSIAIVYDIERKETNIWIRDSKKMFTHSMKFFDNELNFNNFKIISFKDYLLKTLCPIKEKEEIQDTFFSLENGKAIYNDICPHCLNNKLYENSFGCLDVYSSDCKDFYSIDLLLKYCVKCGAVFAKEN